MMGRQTGDQSQLFYLFNLEERIPASHLLRRVNPVVTGVLAELRGKLEPFYSEIGRPSIDPDLMIRMLIVGVLLRHPLRAEAVRGSRAASGLPMVLPARSRRQGARPFDVLGQSSWPLPRQRHLAPCVRGGGAGLHGCRPGQGRRLRRRCQRHGGECQPLSRQAAR